MKRWVIAILMVVGITALLAPDCHSPSWNENSSQQELTDGNEGAVFHLEDHCPDCRTSNHSAPHCHGHFGHSGMLSSHLSVQSFDIANEYRIISERKALEEFTPSPFRPPIS